MEQQFKTPISTSNLFAPQFDGICETFATAFDEHGQFISGHLVTQLEDELCGYHECKYCVTFSTGFWALVAAVELRSIPQKSQVIIPALTYRRLADVVFWAGKTPVMVDVHPKTLAICPSAAENALNDETSLILAVHPIVNCCDVEGFLELSKQSGIPVVFDAVESVHETVGARRVGSFGVGEVFSFHASKLINGLEGGYVCTDDEQFNSQLVRHRDSSVADTTTTGNPLGLTGILNDGHAAFALAGLREISRNNRHNESIYRRYQRELQSVPGIELLSFDESQQTSFKNIVAAVTSRFGVDRDALVESLNSQGILARAYYAPGLHAKPHGFPFENSPELTNTLQAVQRFVNLPCGQRVSEADVDTTCEVLRKIARPQ